MFNQPHARLFRTKVPFEDYRYQLYADGYHLRQIEVLYYIWRKYFLAEKRFDVYRMRVESAAARGVTPNLKMLIKYYDAVKDYMTAKIELEIYYYGAKEPTANEDVQAEE